MDGPSGTHRRPAPASNAGRCSPRAPHRVGPRPRAWARLGVRRRALVRTGDDLRRQLPRPEHRARRRTYYAYGTSTGGAYLPVITSSDLQAWRARSAYAQPACVGGGVDPFFNDAFPCPAPWGQDRAVGGRLTKEVWAPGPAKIGGGWVVYYSMRVSTQPDRFCLGLATAAGPLGPFVDASTQPFQCDADPAGSIDPQPFVDADGTPWLVWKSEGYPCPRCEPTRIWSRRLSPDGRSFASGSQPHVLLETTHPDPGTWEGTVIETPAVVRFQGRLLLFYSGNQWPSTAYAAGWAECASLEAMCQKSSQNPVLRTGGDQNGPGGGDALRRQGGQAPARLPVLEPAVQQLPRRPRLRRDRSRHRRPSVCLPGSAPPADPAGVRRARRPPDRRYASPVGGRPRHRRLLPSGRHPRGRLRRRAARQRPRGRASTAWCTGSVAQGSGAGYGPGGSPPGPRWPRSSPGWSTAPAAASRPPPGPTGSRMTPARSTRRTSTAWPRPGSSAVAPTGTYGHNEAVTRGQMATFLARAYEYRAGRPLTGATNWFPDDEGSAHEENINKAAGAGFTGGRADGVLRPLGRRGPRPDGVVPRPRARPAGGTGRRHPSSLSLGLGHLTGWRRRRHEGGARGRGRGSGPRTRR